jgi:hypothetical protein
VLHETWEDLGKLCQKEGLTTIAQVNADRILPPQLGHYSSVILVLINPPPTFPECAAAVNK